LLATCRRLWQQLRTMVPLMRKAEDDPDNFDHVLQATQALAALEVAIAKASRTDDGLSAAPLSWQAACDRLVALEAALKTEQRYVYGPDWDIKPGKLVSRKGTWLKHNTKFSWEIHDRQKLYLPHGIVMPVLQIGRVTDKAELKRHEWVQQHLCVWLKPSIIRAVESRRDVWFVYWPHWEPTGLAIVALADSWLKRTTQMSGELQPFELVYVPKTLAVQLVEEPATVEEDWEKYRHQHVHLHRRVRLASPPLTVKQDQYDIFIGQQEVDAQH